MKLRRPAFGRSGWVTWLSHFRALVVLFLVGAAPPLVATGCGGEPAPRGDPEAVLALRSAFPEQAASILGERSGGTASPGDGRKELVRSGDGFAAAISADLADATVRRGGLSALLPRRGADPVRFQLPGRLDLSVRETGARGDAELVSGAVVYAGPARSSFWSTTEIGYEEWIHVKAGSVKAGEPIAAWEIEGGQAREVNGAVEIADAAGVTRLHVTAPSAFAVGGRPVPVLLAVRGSSIELRVDQVDGEELLVDPVWSAVPPLNTGRRYHTATALQNGKVLVVGGQATSGQATATVEIYDPATNAWTSAHSLTYPRYYHSATLLSNGTVLVAGGYGTSANELHAELYNPGADTWSAAGTLASPGRYGHVAALVSGGKVLVAGGYGTGYLASAERWDPGTNAWSAAGSMPTSARWGHTAALLQNGKVLVAGGYNPTDSYLNTAVLYTPGTNSWAASAHTMIFKRAYHATVALTGNTKALLTGGMGTSGYLISAEIYDQATDNWTATAVMNGTTGHHTATLQPDGTVLVAGGINVTYNNLTQQYDPVTDTWSQVPCFLITPRAYHTATPLGQGRILVAGGYNGSILDSAEVFDPVADSWDVVSAMSLNRWYHTATLLPNGKVWMSGGYNGVLQHLSTTILYAPSTDSWANEASLSSVRSQHTATLLPSGQVLVAGGYNGSALTAAAVYDPPSNTYVASVGLMSDPRYAHAATILQDGTALVVGGSNANGSRRTTEVYNPSTKVWTTVGQLVTGRAYHTATLLASGKVLVTGGLLGSTALALAEVYDPATQAWTAVGAMHGGRYRHTATLLADGRVLVVGGYNLSALQTAEIYDPSTQAWTWSTIPSLVGARFDQTATLLGNGWVLVAGGYNGAALATAEIYDPIANAWLAAEPMHEARYRHTATLLQDGRVLIAGGVNLPSAEIYKAVAPNDGNPCTIDTWNAGNGQVTHTPAPSGTVCRAATGPCDAAETCNGTSLQCPADAFLPSSTVCRASAGVCDSAESCTGAAASCPSDAKLPSSTVCRASGGVCDVAENCTGTTDACPSDAKLPSSTVCRTSGGVCDVAENCTGSTDSCPSDAFQPSSTVCRTAVGVCDAAENCTGTGASCPSDAKLPSSTVCRASGGVCDVAENCTGSTDSCPADGFLSSSTVCRASGGVCDVAENCTGTGASCPGDAKRPSTFECRASAGECDVAENCTGSTDACPTDALKPSTTVCRPAAAQCDAAETCTGSSTACPADVNAADGATCDDGDACTQTDTCQSGVCTGSNPLTCSAPNATASCVNGACAISACASGFGDCDGAYANGCEAVFYNDAANCGACGHACAAANACANAGVCEATVCKSLPFKLEDGNPCTADACDPVNGMSHTALPDGTVCWDGSSKLTCQTGACAGMLPVIAPTLYADPRHQSPVRGDPADLLLLAGTDFDPATVVVYKAVSDTTQTPTPPATMPTTQTATLGVIDGAVFPNLWRGDNALKVALPASLTPEQAYAIWAATPDPNNAGQWLYSNSVLINDARPMWVSPGPRITTPGATAYPYVYTTADRTTVGLAVGARKLKVVGRNLQPMTGHSTVVRLTTSGPSPSCSSPACTAAGGQCQSNACVIPLTAAASASARYAAEVTLPAAIPLVNGEATDYDLALSRDGGASWVPVPSKLTVLPDPPALAAANTFRPNDYGDDPNDPNDLPINCDPCAAADHTLCISRAVHAAGYYVTPRVPVACSTDQDCASGQICKDDGHCGHVAANIVFNRGACGTGDWFVNSNAPYGSPLRDTYFQSPLHGGEPTDYVVDYAFYGIQVPKGVNLLADPTTTQPTIQTGAAFDQPPFTYWASQHGPSWDPGDGRQYLFELLGDNVVQGLRFTDAHQSPFPPPGSLTLLPAGHDITVTGNFFDGVYAGVGGRGEATPTLPDGKKGVSGLVIKDNQFGIWQFGVGPGVVEDSLTTDNVFWPGGEVSVLAGGFLGARHLDVSSNIVDGDVNTYSGPYGLYGWRAGFFFPMFAPNEDVLVSENTLRCVGSRPGVDGEAISLDSNGGPSLIRWSEEVQAATSDLAASPATSRVTTAWPSSAYWVTGAEALYFKGSWLRVTYGVGLGQARKIIDVTTTATTITYVLSPALDVLPAAGSRIGVGNQAWQFDIANNHINNTCPNVPPAAWSQLLSAQGTSALHYGSSGMIGLYGTSVDLAMDSNDMIDTAGLDTYVQYWDVTTHAADGVHGTTVETPVYFVDIRDNLVTGKFGGVNNTYNEFGSGIPLNGISTTEIDGVPQANPNQPGFAVSVSHNILTDVGMKLPQWSVTQYAAIGTVLQTPGIQSLSPAYIDTLIFQNDVSRTSSIGAPACADGVQSPPYLGVYDSAITNGVELITSAVALKNGEPNYPEGTVLCGNTSVNFACTYTDWPAVVGGSSLSICQ